MYVIIEGLHHVRQTVYIVEEVVIRRPVQAIGEVHLIEVCDDGVIGVQTVQSALFPLQLSRTHLDRHGAWGAEKRHGGVRT